MFSKERGRKEERALKEPNSTVDKHVAKHRYPALSAILLAIALVLSPVGGQKAYAESGADSLEKEFTYDRSVQEPSIDETLTDAQGRIYRLVAVGQPRTAEGFIPVKDYRFVDTRYFSAELYASGDAAIDAQFSFVRHFEKEGYAGTLRRGPVAIVPHYRSAEEQIERTEQLGDLPSEDIRQLPFVKEYTVASDASIGAQSIVTLERTAVQWQTTGYDEDGRPARFTATVTFRGLERRLVVDYVQATATYSGAVSSDADKVTVTATYQLGEDVPTLTAPGVPMRIIDEMLPLAAAPGALPVLVAATSVVLLLGLLFLLYTFIYKNVKLEQREICGRTRVMLRRHIRLQRGEALLEIPARIPLYRVGASCHVTVSRHLANREGRIVILWGKQQIADVALARTIDLGEKLLAATGSEITDMLLRKQAPKHSFATYATTTDAVS
jgi:hypothetical protein